VVAMIRHTKQDPRVDFERVVIEVLVKMGLYADAYFAGDAIKLIATATEAKATIKYDTQEPSPLGRPRGLYAFKSLLPKEYYDYNRMSSLSGVCIRSEGGDAPKELRGIESQAQNHSEGIFGN